ncbi:hypothetical protein DFK10_00005 [Salibaculum griseiflavum]|uniref:Uncharacterized protein n=1 Tax=Salibaculum griseiflavum TaxID=1914409 RepID=A0A2V1P763_9RHOB|nr:hypothetical protein DFK10_00005 [Salibaculum griseiflavum]
MTSIRIEASDCSYKDCEFRWKIAATGNLVQEKIRFEDDHFEVEVDNFIVGFGFKPEKKYWGTAWIDRVVARGFTAQAFLAARDAISDIDTYKKNATASAQKTIDRAMQLEQQIAQLGSGPIDFRISA